MTTQERSQREYRARINKVMDYIESNIDKPADLETLAGVANFSSYHFHRIFTVMTGETPNAFLSRVRIEKAAGLLLCDESTISEIAFACGFNDPSSFSRAFRRHFGMTAKEYRATDKLIYTIGSRRFGKNGQADSKIRRNGAPDYPELCGMELKNIIFMDTRIEVRQMPKIEVAYIRHTGEFRKIKDAYGKLFRWAGPRGLLGPHTRTVTVYHDDPAITSIDKLRQSACITVSGDVKSEGEIGRMTVPEGKYAVGKFDFYGEEGFEKAWNTMCHWFTESGYEPGDGSCYELYLSDPNAGDNRQPHFEIEICMPVKPL